MGAVPGWRIHMGVGIGDVEKLSVSLF
ncbi:hypothetical protein A2U01_0103082, partial [Trifolium medium]|nr:hypothetical protein [Trifolium medium]